jgi:2-polyprenyl-3-methyl-5-hydroxy-6-metoxy-1,4-benzoquinol methylase
MDSETINSYDRRAKTLATFHRSLKPETLYKLVENFFHRGKSTCDLGCGCGRDTEWLSQHGFRAIGVDASFGMIREARKHFPTQEHIHDSLPTLSQLKDRRFANILCSAVLMHLPLYDISPTVRKIFDILEDGGRLILSYRHTKESSGRENGKLYENITSELIENLILRNSGVILEAQSELDSRRDLTWHTIVVEKSQKDATLP